MTEIAILLARAALSKRTATACRNDPRDAVIDFGLHGPEFPRNVLCFLAGLVWAGSLLAGGARRVIF